MQGMLSLQLPVLLVKKPNKKQDCYFQTKDFVRVNVETLFSCVYLSFLLPLSVMRKPGWQNYFLIEADYTLSLHSKLVEKPI